LANPFPMVMGTGYIYKDAKYPLSTSVVA
jgi:hypothetical protein